ncbi:MAG: type II toxin-antitoxin system VapC family toxin [Gemmatimonadales bacterium]
MIAYLDASVLLRLVLGEPEAWEGWTEVQRAVASGLTEVEVLRTLDRLARQGALTVDEVAERRAAALALLERIELIEVSPPILRRAAEPFPTPLGTLDAIHLATALAWREGREPDLTLATHDRALGAAARAFGFRVLGL